MRARVAELLRQQGIPAEQLGPISPRRYLALWWEPAGDELAWSNGTHSGAGQLNHWTWLDYLHGTAASDAPLVRGVIRGWLAEHQVDFGSGDAEATHALLIDTELQAAWVAPIALARRIVRAQSLDRELNS